jgi:hypothetical protein
MLLAGGKILFTLRECRRLSPWRGRGCRRSDPCWGRWACRQAHPEELLRHGHRYTREASRADGECLRELPANRFGNEQSVETVDQLPRFGEVLANLREESSEGPPWNLSAERARVMKHRLIRSRINSNLESREDHCTYFGNSLEDTA